MVNRLAILGSMIAFVSFILPWWSFEMKILQTTPITLQVYPGWLNGDLIDLVGKLKDLLPWIGNNILVDFTIDAIERIFNEFIGILGICGVFFGLGSLLTLIGGTIDNNQGRKIIVHGAILSIIGLSGFYYVWGKPFSLISVPVSFSYFGEILSQQIVSVSWGWSTGFYLAVISVFISLISIPFHSAKTKTTEDASPEKQSSEKEASSIKRSYLESLWETREQEKSLRQHPSTALASTPFFCRLRLHRWTYFGDDTITAVRRYVKLRGQRIPYTERTKMVKTLRVCSKCGLKQRAIIAKENGTLFMEGWEKAAENDAG
jgi:hypothetical protein